MRDDSAISVECTELLERLRPLISWQAYQHLLFRGPSATMGSLLRTVLDAPHAVQEEANEYWSASFCSDPTGGMTDDVLRKFVQTGIRRAEHVLSRDALAHVKSMTGREQATALAVLLNADDAAQREMSAERAGAFQPHN